MTGTKNICKFREKWYSTPLVRQKYIILVYNTSSTNENETIVCITKVSAVNY